MANSYPWAARIIVASKEAERIGERIRPIRARPWPERPVSEANKSGKHPAVTRPGCAYPRTFQVHSASSRRG